MGNGGYKIVSQQEADDFFRENASETPDNDIESSRKGTGANPHNAVIALHLGRRRCTVILACLFLAAVSTNSLLIVGPMLSSVIRGGGGADQVAKPAGVGQEQIPSSQPLPSSGDKQIFRPDQNSDSNLEPPSEQIPDEDDLNDLIVPKQIPEENLVNEADTNDADTVERYDGDSTVDDRAGEGNMNEEDTDGLDDADFADGESEEPEEGTTQTAVFEYDAKNDYRSITSVYNESISNRFVQRCAKNWPEDTQKRFMAQCGYWASRYAQWEQQVTDNSKAVRYVCDAMSNCHGWGDRLGGIQAAFIKALELKRKFDIRMEHIRKYFSTCAFEKPSAQWDKTVVRVRDSCVSESSTHCSSFIPMACPRGDIIAHHMWRTCMRGDHCSHIKEYRPQIYNTATMFGCGMRAMIEPNEKLLNIEYPFMINSKSMKMKLKDIHQLMKKYYIFVIHMRMGDKNAFGRRDPQLLLSRERYILRPFRCASTIEASLSDSEGKINGKEVRYFVASDMYEFKEWIWSIFGDKAMGFNFMPRHISKVTSDSAERTLTNEWGEWLTLGLGDELVINKIGTNPTDLYSGRESGYSMTSWLYQLKHLIYDGGRCLRYSIPLHGIFDQSPRECYSELLLASQRLSQPHLKVLVEANVAFPKAYVNDTTKKINFT